MTTPLDSLIEFSRGERDEALNRLAAALADARGAEAKVRLLVEYRTEYDARRAAAVAGGISALRLGTYVVFLAKLDAAIAQQQDIARQRGARAAAERTAWQDTEVRLQGYATLRARRAALAAVEEKRKEQKQNDEFAARALPAYAK